jgi:CheY-like chemotaxis protein
MMPSNNESLGPILVVEDDPDQVFFLRRALGKLNVARPLHVVTNGEQAVLYLSKRNGPPPALLLLDLHVPRIGGFRILDWMRHQPDLREVPAVVLTSSIEPDDRREADRLGVLAYLCKPIDAEGLREVIDLPAVRLGNN